MRHQSLGKKDTVYVPRIATSPSLNSTPQNTLSCLCFCQQFSVRDSVFFVTVFQAEQALVFALFLTFFSGLSLCHLEVLSAASSSNRDEWNVAKSGPARDILGYSEEQWRPFCDLFCSRCIFFRTKYQTLKGSVHEFLLVESSFNSYYRVFINT